VAQGIGGEGVRAVVLVGGQGTRLRPLTETIKKELLPLVDRAILDHTLDRLVRHGVHEVVMSSPHLEQTFHPFIEGRRGDPDIAWITEAEALDTGGAIVNALHHLDPAEPFFAMNGDILTDLDLTAMLALHRSRRAAATIALHDVPDARAFGLIQLDPVDRVLAFREKPEDPIPGSVNAGTYVLDPAALGAWSADRPISIEREIFPALIDEDRQVHGFRSGAYWRDLGTPENYLAAHRDLLLGRVEGLSYTNPWIHEFAEVDPDATVGPLAAVGAGVSLGPASRVEESVLHPGSAVGLGASVVRSILGPRASIGAEASVVGCVLGEGSTVADRQSIEGIRIQPFSQATP
jgi:mannose-1-phosphate guanylyltransferase